MRESMRWLCLVMAVSGAWALPARAEEPTPVDCGTAECEGIREMKELFNAEFSFFQEKDRFSGDLAEVGFAPVPCADGSRAPLPPVGSWVAGCHFVFQVTSVVGAPSSARFSAMAQGVRGSPAANLILRIGMTDYDDPEGRTFWLERDGHRRAVGWEECQPAASFTCEAQLREGRHDLRGLSMMERGFFAEKDRYSTLFQEVGFLPFGCTDGTRPTGPDSTWLGGCRFIYHVELTPSGFLATARAVSGHIAGTLLKIDEQGSLTTSSLPWECQ